MSKRMAILTSGGDAPGMNAAVRAATLIALSQGYEVFGVQRGYRGLVDDDLVPLGPGDVVGILREGGTLLGSARCLEFIERPARDRARANLAGRGIDQLLVIGGNGSLTGALAISDPAEGGDAVRVAGIPASIDNDIGLTGLAIGVDTAMNTIVEAIDKIADTATAHRRTFIVEVMGRDCGYLAMTATISSSERCASGNRTPSAPPAIAAVIADGVLFPEAHRSEDEIVAAVVRAVRAVRARPHKPRRVIVIKAEGVPVPADRLKQRVDDELRAAGSPADEVESRVTVLGHVVRGGRPSAFDRLLASRLANVAIRSLIGGDTRKMAAWMPPADLPEECGERSEADPYCWLVDLAAALAETESLLTGSSPLARWRAGVFEDIEDVLLL